MKKTLGFLICAVCIIGGGLWFFCRQSETVAISASKSGLEKSHAQNVDLGLEKTLEKYNQWKANHPNAIVRFKATRNGLSLTITSYYLEKKFKIVTQMLDGNNDISIEFLSDNGEVLYFFPSTSVTVKEESPLKTYILTEMGWDQELTVAKVKSFGGKLEYRQEDGIDRLIFSVPANPFPKVESKEPVSYDSTLELHLDETGKVVKQVGVVHGTPVFSSDMEYITFDAEKIKAEYDKIMVKSVVDEGVKLQDAVVAEITKNSTKMKNLKDYIKSSAPR